MEQVYRKNGITILSKFDPNKRVNPTSKVALVLAGGAITGGAFKVGGLRALDEMLTHRQGATGREPFHLTDLDLFVGLSAGSIVASALAAGIDTGELYRIMVGNSEQYQPMRPLDFMRPNLLEPPERVALTVSKYAEVIGAYASRKLNPKTRLPFTLKSTLLKLAAVTARIIPTGFFDARGVRDYLQRQISRAGLPDDFVGLQRARQKSLYITAVDVNTGSQIVFGPEERYAGVPISDAVAASCGLPVWYRTVRVKNPLFGEAGERRHLDLADGGLVRTANVGVALKRNADLIIVYNPFTPIRYATADRSLYEHGPYALISQIFRTVLGSRLDIGKEKIMFDPSANADVIYIEPSGEDLEFFQMNPLNFWSKRRAAEHGYRSVRAALAENYDVVRGVFARHGIELSLPSPEPSTSAPLLLSGNP